MDDDLDIAELTVQIVTSYVTNNSIRGPELPAVIQDVHQALLASLHASTGEPPPELTPAVPLGASVKPNVITCLECGATYKTIKRHLHAAHKLTPDEYRERWSLLWDYPLTAPNYSAARSALARSTGLGGKGKR